MWCAARKAQAELVYLLSFALALRSPVQTELEQNQPSPSEKVARGLETRLPPLSTFLYSVQGGEMSFSLEVNGHVELILTLNERRATGSRTSEKLLCESRTEWSADCRWRVSHVTFSAPCSSSLPGSQRGRRLLQRHFSLLHCTSTMARDKEKLPCVRTKAHWQCHLLSLHGDSKQRPPFFLT